MLMGQSSPIFFKEFITITASTNGALLLSYALAQERGESKRDKLGFWPRTAKEFESDLGLKKHALSKAKQACFPILESKREGMPAITLYRINWGYLNSIMLKAFPSKQKPS